MNKHIKKEYNSHEYFINDANELRPETYDDLSRKERENDINNINAIIGQWIQDLEQNTKLRKKYAYTLFGLLATQILLANIIVFLIGFSIIELQESYFRYFFTLVVGEIISFVYIVVKYLFRHNDDVLEQIIKLFKHSYK